MQQSKQLRMILLVSAIVVALFLSIMIIQSRGILTASKGAEQPEETKVTIITSDVIVDQSWGSLAYKGKVKIEAQFPVDVQLYSEIDSVPLMKDTVIEAIDNESRLIIGHGREFTATFTELAPQYPDVQFITVHGKATHPNQSVYTFDQGDIEYFAALAASLKTKTNKVAILDAIDNRKNNIEFETALLHYNPNVDYTYSVVHSRDDGVKALRVMNKLLDKGVDVIYSKGNAYNREVIDAATKANVYVIGYLDDQSYMGKDTVLTSVLNDTPQVYVAIMKDYFSEEGIPSGKVMLDASDGVYKLAPFGPMYTEDETKYIESEMTKFANGELTFNE
ncbi:BMP family ABC transporter substrate-binding protein [Bacillus sp. HMF5848]|uniref:BMP family ABC transporter substrate-binding protein n=1 Tax=Bacillus sp. HMF5848 TaxID=2495421 RepID=UPI000F7A8246|nr:BMP family ABC transporter substrate-binding protein [Bacillus sp. HMF5848]RSK25963.1 BMP family ABC transporter substrate-binding protein [Bacillus sp. HMF5848]